LLTECYWFAGYAYSEQEPDSTSVALIPHPVQHGVFVDDAFPAEVDTIAAYGKLGFGTQGLTPCPNQAPGPDGPGDPPPGGNEDEASLPNPTDLMSVQISPELMEFGPDPYRDAPISEIAFRNSILRAALRGVGAVSIQRTCPGATSADLIAHDAEGRPLPLADLTNLYRIRFRDSDAAVRALAPLRRTSLLGNPSVVPDFKLPVSTVPCDSLFDNFDSCWVADSQWPLRNDGIRPPQLHNWACDSARVGYDIGVEEAWALTGQSYGDPTVVVGIVDTGILGGNSEQPSVYHNDLRVIPLTSQERALIQQHPNTDWCVKHGTIMAGMAAAKTDNVSGIAGVCGGCSLLDIENAGCDQTQCSAHGSSCFSIEFSAWPPHAYAAAHSIALPANATLAAILVSAAGAGSDENNFYLMGDTMWVQYRASAPVYFASRSDGRFLAWARKKSAHACAGYPSLMSQRVQLARLGIRDCYLYRPDDQWSNAKITGYTYAWRLGSGPLHFLIAEDQMRLTYCKVRDAIIGVGNTGGSDALGLRVTPNPGVSAVSIFLAAPVSSALRVEAFDAAGRMVRRFSVRGGDVVNRIQWDCRDQLGRTVPNGAYWIRAITGSGVQTARLVVLR
jgi:hypothetical protein